jgi:hypothetical protein
MRFIHAEDASISFAAGSPEGEDSWIRLAIEGIVHAAGASSKETAMQQHLRSPELALQAGQVLTLDDARGVRIQPRTGTVWITQEGSALDHIVGPGDAIVVARNGRTVVQALQNAWITIADSPWAANDPHGD